MAGSPKDSIFKGKKKKKDDRTITDGFVSHTRGTTSFPELDFSQNEKMFHVHFMDGCHKLC